MIHILKAIGFIILYMIVVNIIIIPLKNIDPIEIWIMEIIIFVSGIIMLFLGGELL